MKTTVLTTPELRSIHDKAEATKMTTRLFDDAFWDWVDPDGRHVVVREWPQGMSVRWEMLCKMKEGTPGIKRIGGIPTTRVTLDVPWYLLTEEDQEVIWNE